MNDERREPTPEDAAATVQYMGWVKGQAFATAHLWAFQLFQAGFSVEQANAHFASLLNAYENGGDPSIPIGELQTAIKLNGLSHLEEIFQVSLDALAFAQSE